MEGENKYFYQNENSRFPADNAPASSSFEFDELYSSLKNKLLGAFHSLIGLQKEVLKLYVEGYDDDEIAEILKKEKSNISSTKENAIKNLKKRVTPLVLKGNNKTVASLLRDFYNDNL